MESLVKRLRNRESVKLFNSIKKEFYQFQINNNSKRIHWEMFVSKDRKNWIKLNSYVSLSEIIHFRNKIIELKNPLNEDNQNTLCLNV